MDKTEKAEVVEDLKGVFANAGSLVVAHYTGMTVAQMGDLRARMRAAGASFKVAKNRLAVRALQGTAVEGISHLFKGPTGIAYSKDPDRGFEGCGRLRQGQRQARDPGRFGRSDDIGCERRQSPRNPAVARRAEGQDRGAARGTRDEDRRRSLQAPAGQLARVIGAYSKKEAA